MPPPHITVCVCTFRRPNLLEATLASLRGLETGQGAFTYSVVVADNDRAGSAEKTVAAFAAGAGFPVAYAIEPQQNISLARNRAAALATGDYVAWLDDDEFAAADWLLQLFRTLNATGADGVLGPVQPVFETPPPPWIIRGRFFHKPRRTTGLVLNWHQTSTANVLVKRALLTGPEPAFRAQFGSGCEDLDFFQRMMRRGHRFVWCEEALLSEIVPPSRWHSRYLFRRALLRGRNGAALSGFRAVAKAIVAVPLYGLVIPLVLPFGRHHGVRFLMKWGDHAGLLIGKLRLPFLGRYYLTG
jgi:glycosyltransferase involved in cell wall biosynthesis